MAGITFKDYSDEEGRIYEETMEQIRKNFESGMHIDEACASVAVADEELGLLIREDFLKITIAEMRYTKGLPLEVVARELKIPHERVLKVHRMMIEEVMQTQAEKFGSVRPEDLGLDDDEKTA